MPTDSLIVTVVVIAVFTFFSILLAWATHQAKE